MTAQIPDVASELPKRRLRGNCKWFDGLRGFGFIGGNDGRDYFVHQTSIKSKGWRNLEVNQEVEFEVLKDTDRLKAVNVTAPGGLNLNYKQRKQQNFCFKYQKWGSCIYGRSCKFSHNLSDSGKFSMVGHNMSVGRSTSMRGSPGSGGHSSVANALNERVSRGVCYSWRGGVCQRGELCRFDHPLHETMLHFPDTYNGVCYPWQEGKCNRGERCPFIHVPTE